MLIEERIRKFEYKLNDTDDQIIEYILQHKQEVAKLSIQSLADKLYTVPNTVIRLSKKLGYDGYSQLKNSLKEELSESQDLPQDDLHFNIKQTFNILDMAKIKMICDMLCEAKKVIFFGVGDSVPFCEMMVKNLKVAGILSEFYLHRHDMVYAINQAKKDDIVYLISLSGETPQVLEMAKLAKDKGTRVISLTHFYENSLQKLADVNLFCYSPKKMLNGYNVTDKTSVMIILQVLSENLWRYVQPGV